jgi:hypothetical protein
LAALVSRDFLPSGVISSSRGRLVFGAFAAASVAVAVMTASAVAGTGVEALACNRCIGVIQSIVSRHTTDAQQYRRAHIRLWHA